MIAFRVKPQHITAAIWEHESPFPQWILSSLIRLSVQLPMPTKSP
jgi:hypothetical protein